MSRVRTGWVLRSTDQRSHKQNCGSIFINLVWCRAVKSQFLVTLGWLPGWLAHRSGRLKRPHDLISYRIRPLDRHWSYANKIGFNVGAEFPTNLAFPETRIIGLHFCRRLYRSIVIQICAAIWRQNPFSASTVLQQRCVFWSPLHKFEWR